MQIAASERMPVSAGSAGLRSYFVAVWVAEEETFIATANLTALLHFDVREAEAFEHRGHRRARIFAGSVQNAVSERSLLQLGLRLGARLRFEIRIGAHE